MNPRPYAPRSCICRSLTCSPLIEVRLQSGALAVFSPTALTPEVKATVQKLGNQVQYIAATDMEHHIYMSDWANAYPQAALLGPEGLQEKREKNAQTAGQSFKHIWTKDNRRDKTVDVEFDREFDVEFVSSHANKELVFCHKPSRTLIEADLMFNLPATEQFSKAGESPTSGILTRLFNAMGNAHGSAIWQKRFLWYGASSSNRSDFNQSVKRINAWNFDRIIPCHGDVIESDGKTAFQRLFRWHLDALQS